MSKIFEENKKEFAETKATMKQSFGKSLSEIKASEKEIEQLREQLLQIKENWEAGELEERLDENINKLNVYRKLQATLTEEARYAEIDKAIAFLDKFIDGSIHAD